MKAIEKAKIALRKHLLENKEQVKLDLERMREISIGTDMSSYINNLSNSFSIANISISQYKSMSNNYDSFQRALCAESGLSEQQIRAMMSEEFLKRNKLEDEEKKMYLRCIFGHESLTGEQYFFYNYCKTDEKLPELGTYDKRAMQDYRNHAYEERKTIITNKESMKLFPTTPEECFFKT